jgi:hypothetical protein
MSDYRRLASGVIVVACCCCLARNTTAEGPVARPLQRTGPAGGAGPARTEPAQPTATVTTPNPSPAPADEHPLKPAIRLAQKGLDALADVKDYQATIARRELVGNELVVETMQMKFREEPFSVYLLFGGQNAGREVLYVDGRNDNKLMAHEGSGLTSFIGTISLAPDSPQVLKQSRHMITEIGLRNMIGAIITRWEEESRYGECDVKYYQNATLNERECLAIECTHPRPRRQFKFHISRLYLDKETGIGIRVENFGFPLQQGGKPVLIEEYTYSNLKTNVGLTDIDFDRSNPRYKF